MTVDDLSRCDPACKDPDCSYRAEIEMGYWRDPGETDALLAALLKIAEEPGTGHEKAALAWAARKAYLAGR